MFDSRAFTVPLREEVINYLVWRQKDALRNSVSMAAQAALGHKACQGLKSGQLQEDMFQAGINWNDYPTECKRGSMVARAATMRPVSSWLTEPVERAEWTVRPAIEFTRERGVVQLALDGETV